MAQFSGIQLNVYHYVFYFLVAKVKL